MAKDDRRHYRQVKISAELYLQLKRAKRFGESFGDVIRRLMAASGPRERGPSDEERMALARIARHARERKLASGANRPPGPES